MSAVSTTPTPAGLKAEHTPDHRTKLLRWSIGGLSLAAVATAVTLAVWPESAADQARADGERLGSAVTELYDAQSAADVNSAVADVHDAARTARIHAGDQVQSQVDQQADALSRAADGYVGAQTSSDEFDADVYQSELDIARDDFSSQADEFRSQGPEVQQAFWNGVDDGLNG